MVISKHAYQRSAERLGLNKKATDRMMQRVLKQGIPAEETKGWVKHWTADLYKRSNDLDAILLYGDKAFLFNEEVLVTILNIPSEYMRTMNQIRKKSVMAYA